MEAEPILNMQPLFTEADADAVAHQVRIGFVGPGPKTRSFAEGLAHYAGRSHCELTTSGTMALSVAAKALGLGPGDEILVPAYGVISTINAFASFGFTPRLVDIDRNSGCLTARAVKARITPNTRAVCFVNFSGNTGLDLVEVEALCRDKGLFLIEDAACAVGHAYQGRQAGSFGDVSTYSFSVPKVLTTGQGGAILTHSQDVRDAVVRFTDQGDTEWRRTNLNRDIGNNLRHNDILSALGAAQLDTLHMRLDLRRQSHNAMRSILGNVLHRVAGEEAPLHNIVLCEARDQLAAYLAERGIKAAVQYRAIFDHPPYQALEDAPFENAVYWGKHALYLPFGTALSVEDAERTARAVLESGCVLHEVAA